MHVAVASGKGGTGKTLLSTNLSAALKMDLADLDVEEPNDHIFFPGEAEESRVCRMVPHIIDQRCNLCGVCVEVCAFNALTRLPTGIIVHKEMCHGCGACIRLCPEEALVDTEHDIGSLVRVKGRDRSLTYGVLNVGEPIAVPLIKAVKAELGSDVIRDCPPGTACPVVESLKGSDFCILVTEPTPFGLHDLDLAIRTLRRLKIRHGIVINKDGKGRADIDGLCRSMEVPLLGHLPFRRDIAQRYARGELIIHREEDRQAVLAIWDEARREARG